MLQYYCKLLGDKTSNLLIILYLTYSTLHHSLKALNKYLWNGKMNWINNDFYVLRGIGTSLLIYLTTAMC